MSSTPTVSAPPKELHFYYPDEGFGNIYRRVLTNAFFTRLVQTTRIRHVAEMPLDSYGIVGAGSLIFSQLGVEVTLVSDDSDVLERARLLMDFNGVRDGVRYLHSDLEHLDVPPDAFDLSWSFDRLQTLRAPEAFIREQCRVSKAVMIMVPNARNYGQFAHHVYHRLAATRCDYVGPRKWMHWTPIEALLRQNGLAITRRGFIDVPWWPEFPELPNLVRQLLRRPPLELDQTSRPEVNPRVIAASDVPHVGRRVHRSAFIELGPWPDAVKRLFAHNLYVIGCKPHYREELGL